MVGITEGPLPFVIGVALLKPVEGPVLVAQQDRISYYSRRA